MNMTSLRAANIARDQEWNTGSERVSMTFRATELAGEVGEACNVIKKLERERIGLVGSRDTKEHLAEELADIVICTDLLAMDAGIDLGTAIAAKFNATSEKNGLSTRLSISMPATARPFEASPEMVKAALDLVWEESQTHGDLVSRLWGAMAAVASDQPSAAREPNWQAVIDRPIVGIENRTPQEVHDILRDRIKRTALSSPDHADAGNLVEGEHLPQDVINLVIAAREAFDTGVIPEDEEYNLDKALEPFGERVPYENEPDALPSAPSQEVAGS